ncbi:MAG: hypothetical protein Q8N98_01415, partial [bacterium]|nr:hypothetical protein [bacterium]
MGDPITEIKKTPEQRTLPPSLEMRVATAFRYTHTEGSLKVRRPEEPLPEQVQVAMDNLRSLLTDDTRTPLVQWENETAVPEDFRQDEAARAFPNPNAIRDQIGRIRWWGIVNPPEGKAKIPGMLGEEPDGRQIALRVSPEGGLTFVFLDPSGQDRPDAEEIIGYSPNDPKIGGRSLTFQPSGAARGGEAGLYARWEIQTPEEIAVACIDTALAQIEKTNLVPLVFAPEDLKIAEIGAETRLSSGDSGADIQALRQEALRELASYGDRALTPEETAAIETPANILARLRKTLDAAKLLSSGRTDEVLISALYLPPKGSGSEGKVDFYARGRDDWEATILTGYTPDGEPLEDIISFSDNGGNP